MLTEKRSVKRRSSINSSDLKRVKSFFTEADHWYPLFHLTQNGRRDVSDEDAFLASLLESRDVDEDLLASLFEERDDEDSLERRVIVNGKDYGVTPLGRAGRIWKFLGRVISGIGGRVSNFQHLFQI